MDEKLQWRKGRLFKIAVGGSVAALGGGAALAADGNTPDPTPVEAPTDHVTLDLEDGTVDVAVDDEIAPDLDGEDDGVVDQSVDQESVESVESVDSVDQESVESVDSVDSVDEDSVDQESADQESADSDDDDDSAGDDD